LIRLLFVPLWFVALDMADAGDKQLCQLTPGTQGEWHYRTKVNGKTWRCYYEGERMKPREELYWAEAPAAPSEPKWQLEQRWKGE